MTRTVKFARAPILALPLLVALCSVARCDDPAESSRDSIIQNVREDVRRHIRAREAGKPKKSPELSEATTPRGGTKKRNHSTTK